MLFLEDYLIKCGLSETDVVEGVIEKLGFADDDLLFFAGSLVEGLGNNRSDVDLYLFTNRDLSSQFDFTNTVILSVGNVIADVEVYQWGDIDALVGQLSEYPPNEDRDYRKTVSFSVGQLKLLHAISVRKLARGDERRFAHLDSIAPAALARILFDRSVAHINSMKADIGGALECGDFETGRYLLSQYYWHIVSVVLTANGYTNPSEKWRVKNFAALKADPIQFSRSVMGHRAIVDYFLADGNTQPPRDGELLSWYQRLTYISNILIPMGQHMFQSGHAPGLFPLAAEHSHGAGESAQREDGRIRHLPRLHHDVMIRFKNKEFMISHSSKASAQFLNPIAFQFLVFFDGETACTDAITALGGTTGLGVAEVRQQIEHMSQFLLANSYV